MTYRIGVVGGGQLARMMIPQAVNLGIELRVLAEAEGSSARLAATRVGDYRDLETVREFARGVDVVTFDHEHVPQPVLRALVEDGVAVHPGPDALRFAQNKLAMRARLTELGLPVPDWAAVSSEAEVAAFLRDHDGRAVLKTPTGGYDGKGVRFVTDAAQAADWLAPEFLSRFPREGGEPALLIEEAVPFVRELSQLAARSSAGEYRSWGLVETVQRRGVCFEVFAPAPEATPIMTEVTDRIARTVAEELGVTGVLAVELFATEDDRVLVNELAMRPHNSGHWTMDGAVTGQFEQHLRAVAGLPLGDTARRAAHVVMTNILGGPTEEAADGRLAEALSGHPRAKVHMYGKSHRPGRKVGHVNVYGGDLDEAVAEARAVAAALDAELD